MLLKARFSKFNLLNYKYIFFYSFKPTNHIGYYRYADKAEVSVFCKCMENKIKNDKKRSRKIIDCVDW